jgi:hypothetical protein
MIIVVFIFGFMAGFIVSKIIDQIIISKKNELIRQVFYDILTSLETGGCTFESRVNDHVMIRIGTGIYTGHLMTINLMERGLSISKNNKVLYISDFVKMNFPKDTIIEDIIKQVEYRFGKKINDTVEVNGIKIDRDFLDKTLKETGQSMGGDLMGGMYDEKLVPSEVDILPSVDDILDKILLNGGGVDCLTEEEREILDNRSEDGGKN